MDDFAWTGRQRRRLREELGRCRDARLYRRLLALLEVDAGRRVGAVAQSLGVTRQSVYNWLWAYQRHPTLASLRDRERSGWPPAWDDGIREELRGLLEASPREQGYLANTWTVPLLQQYLRHAYGEESSQSTVRRELHGLGYTWKRSRYVLDPDPHLEKKTPDLPRIAALGPPQRDPGRG